MLRHAIPQANGPQRQVLYQTALSLARTPAELAAMLPAAPQVADEILNQLGTMPTVRWPYLRGLAQWADGLRAPTIATLFILNMGMFLSAGLDQADTGLNPVGIAKGALPFDIARAPLFRTRLFRLAANDHVLFFTNRGRVFLKKVHEVPEGSRTSKGKHVANFVGIDPKDPSSQRETIAAIVPVSEWKDSAHLVTITVNGLVKRTALKAYSNIRQTGIIGVAIEDGDALGVAKGAVGKATARGIGRGLCAAGDAPAGGAAAGACGAAGARGRSNRNASSARTTASPGRIIGWLSKHSLSSMPTVMSSSSSPSPATSLRKKNSKFCKNSCTFCSNKTCRKRCNNCTITRT